jgi:hypothetical protein
MGLLNRLRNNNKAETNMSTYVSSASTSNVPSPRRAQAVELGTIDYVNLTPDGRHGDFETAVRIAQETGKPIFANFVEWSG